MTRSISASRITVLPITLAAVCSAAVRLPRFHCASARVSSSLRSSTEIRLVRVDVGTANSSAASIICFSGSKNTVIPAAVQVISAFSRTIPSRVGRQSPIAPGASSVPSS